MYKQFKVLNAASLDLVILESVIVYATLKCDLIWIAMLNFEVYCYSSSGEHFGWI